MNDRTNTPEGKQNETRPAGAKPVAVVRVGSLPHGPFNFDTTPHGVDTLPSGVHQLYLESRSPAMAAAPADERAALESIREYGRANEDMWLVDKCNAALNDRAAASPAAEPVAWQYRPIVNGKPYPWIECTKEAAKRLRAEDFRKTHEVRDLYEAPQPAQADDRAEHFGGEIQQTQPQQGVGAPSSSIVQADAQEGLTAGQALYERLHALMPDWYPDEWVDLLPKYQIAYTEAAAASSPAQADARRQLGVLRARHDYARPFEFTPAAGAVIPYEGIPVFSSADTQTEAREDAYVAKRMTETLASVYATIIGDDQVDENDGLNAIQRVEKAAQVLRLEVELYRAQADALEAPRYREWQHLREHGEWSNGVPDWARAHDGRMNDLTAACAVIDELAALSAHPYQPTQGA